MRARTLRRTLRPAALAALALLLAAAASTARAATALSTVRVASGLFRPLFVTSPPGDSTRIFIVEQHTGRIMIVRNDTLLTQPFMTQTNLSTGNEQGLLGLAFDPNYATNGLFYVDYTRSNWATVIKRYQVSANPDSADTANGVTILVQSQPQSNHNGGWIAFGPDGFLYVSLGDGGGAGDTGTGHDALVGNGQSDGTRLGKLLRLDVSDPDTTYVVPPSNPFYGQGSPKDEFWAKGLRNPWRCSFDRGTNDLYIADVGQNLWEEIDYQAAGAPDAAGRNYGWRKFEGYAIYNCPSPCDSSGLTRPIYVYDHGAGRCSITGGYVYRGSAIPDLRGSYFFADYCSETIWTIRVVGGAITEGPVDRTADLAPGGGLTIDQITSFGEDARGELYICDQGGEVFRIVPETISGVGALGPAPGALLLGNASPNPSEGGFSFRVGLPGTAEARLSVYDASGRLVRTLVEGALEAGTREMEWDARDDRGARLPGGVYLLRLESGGAVETRKVAIVR